MQAEAQSKALYCNCNVLKKRYSPTNIFWNSMIHIFVSFGVVCPTVLMVPITRIPNMWPHSNINLKLEVTSIQRNKWPPSHQRQLKFMYVFMMLTQRTTFREFVQYIGVNSVLIRCKLMFFYYHFLTGENPTQFAEPGNRIHLWRSGHSICDSDWTANQR